MFYQKYVQNLNVLGSMLKREKRRMKKLEFLSCLEGMEKPQNHSMPMPITEKVNSFLKLKQVALFPTINS